MLTEPTLLLDEGKCRANIKRMADKARANKVVFRPHFKTHQSHDVGRWFREYEVSKITVSSLKMAVYFAEDGWDDITVAFPVNVNEKERIHSLAEKISLSLLLVSPDTVEELARVTQHPLGLFIEVDTGYHRTGVDPDNTGLIEEILIQINAHPQFHFGGFLAHDGHSYKLSNGKSKILSIQKDSISIMRKLKARYIKDFPRLVTSLGDTPTCSLSDSFEGLDEIRPGNLVFYDVMQRHLGSCRPDDIAVAMACPVVARYPERSEVVVHGGAVHFSKDFLQLPDGTTHYGQVVWLSPDGWSTEDTGMYLKGMSQEHGIVHAEKENIENIKIGDFLGVLPVHSCLTADVMKSYQTLKGKRISMMR